MKLSFKRNNLLTLIAGITYFDLLFLPYFQLIIIPYSLPLIVIGIFLLERAYFPPKTKMVFFLLLMLMSLSVCIGFFVPSSAPYAIDNVKRVLQFSTSFLYLIFFFSAARQIRLESILKVISIFFVGYVLLLSVQFLFDPIMVNSLMSGFYGRLVTSEDIALEHFRFSYMFTDPNTAGYFVLIAVLPWLTFYRAIYLRLTLFTLCIVVTLFVQSRGALVAAFIAFIISSIPSRWFLLSFRAKDISNLLKGTLFATIIAGISITLLLVYLGELPIYEMGLERVSETDSYATGGSRFEIWTEYITHLIPFPLGIGYQFNVPFSYGQFFPHSDVLRFVYSYGLIAVVLFLYFFIRTGRKFPLLFFPALVALLINSLIDEQKMFSLYLASLGVMLAIAQRPHLRKINITTE